MYPWPYVAQTPRARSLVARAKAAAAIAAEHAAGHDRDATFPLEGLSSLAESGYLAAIAPVALGGEGAGVTDCVLASLEVGKGDGSLGLVASMHVALLGRTRDARLWPDAVLERVMRAVVDARGPRGALINSLATEPEMGSPSRGGMPRTRAVRQTDGSFVLSGRKTFSSGSPVLRWGVVSAAVSETSDGQGTTVANFLVPLDGTPGVSIEPTWDTLGMRATGSDTLVFENVALPPDAELPRPRSSGDERPPVPHERAWSLVVSAAYLGIAEAARDEAVEFARTRRPTALGGQSIASVPQVRRRVGEVDLRLYQARSLLVGLAREWDAAADDEAGRTQMDSALAVAKVTAAGLAIEIVDAAMRVVGGTSIDRALPLERHYRDVRGALHHPPQEDAALESLAHDALD